MPAIAADGLRVSFGTLDAVDGVSFAAEAGEVLALIGPNGAGKTTTVETLEGFRSPTAGAVTVLGLDPVADRRLLAPRIGVMLQEGGVYPVLSAARTLRLFAAYYDDPRDPDELLELCGLRDAADRPAKRLSGGERQRLSLALALVGRPRVAFLDEPTSGVDPAGRLVVRDTIASLRADGVCVLLTTHELAEAERVADRVVILDRGRVVAAGRPEELVAPVHEIRFTAPPGIDLASLGSTLGVPVSETEPGEYRIAAPPASSLIAGLATWLSEHDLPLAELRTGRQSLEDAFLHLTGRDGAPDGTGTASK